MKLEAKTMSVLKNYSQINPSLLFKEGNVLTTISPNKTILAKATVPNTFDRRCAVYELSKFLGGMSLAENPDISFKENAVVISDEATKSSSSIAYAAETAIKVPPEKNLALPSVDISLNVTDAQIKNVIRAAGVYSLPYIAFVGDGSSVKLQAFDAKNNNGNVYSIPVAETDKTFKIIFTVENILKLMAGDYRVDISSKLLAHFIGTDIEYWVAVETTSTF